MFTLLLRLILVTSFIFSGCAHNSSISRPLRQKITARITFYNKWEDKWGNRIAMSPKMRAKQGETVAAHPAFRFGTEVSIPFLKGLLDNDDKFIVQDRGSAVTKMRASRGKTPVFDVYLGMNKSRAKMFARSVPEYMDVYVSARPLLKKFEMN